MIGVNVFGLVLGLSYDVASLVDLDMASTAGLIGGLAAVALAFGPDGPPRRRTSGCAPEPQAALLRPQAYPTSIVRP
jgi:hypothetical protein